MKNEQIVFSYGKATMLFGAIFMACLGGFSLWLLVLTIIHSRFGVVSTSILIFGGLFFSLYAVKQLCRACDRIVIDQDSITRIGLIGSEKIFWNEIVQVKWLRSFAEEKGIEITAKSGASITITVQLRGLPHLTHHIKEHLPNDAIIPKDW
ncbi:MAG: hypothetical protein SF097_24880 [Acidobacteriota bacterium]|nr:hypothetical protein [Acidobacteriota bacterium]